MIFQTSCFNVGQWNLSSTRAMVLSRPKCPTRPLACSSHTTWSLMDVLGKHSFVPRKRSSSPVFSMHGNHDLERLFYLSTFRRLQQQIWTCAFLIVKSVKWPVEVSFDPTGRDYLTNHPSYAFERARRNLPIKPLTTPWYRGDLVSWYFWPYQSDVYEWVMRCYGSLPPPRRPIPGQRKDRCNEKESKASWQD